MDEKEAIFLRVVEAGSFKAAADQMRTDPSSVSRKVAALEARLGVKLLERSTRRTMPTEAGAQYYDGLHRLHEEQLALEARVTGNADQPTGLLRVAAPVDFGALFVAPVLRDLQIRHPQLSVELLLGSSFMDLTEQGLDVAVRIGRLPNSSLIAKRLGSVPRVLVASRGYVSRCGIPATPDALACHSFIFYTRAQSQTGLSLTKDGTTHHVEMRGNFTVNSVAAIRTLVAEGHGIHLGPVWAFREGLEAGDLVALLPDYQLEAYPLHALYTATSYVPAKIRAFIDAMVAHAKQLAYGME